MLTLLAAAAMLQPAAASALPGDPDMRCMAAYLFAVGQMANDPAATADDKSAATTMVMYFFGKLRGRMPKVDVKTPIKRLVESPAYLTDEIKIDLGRCGAEYEARGEELNSFDEK